MWIAAAILSALFAGLTAIFSKCGVKNCNSNVAIAIRTSVVLIFAWFIVFVTGAYNELNTISSKSLVFLILSGIATGASWICYFKALALGEVSRVAVVDKSSVVFTILFAIIMFPEERTFWWLKLICLFLIAIGTFLMSDIKNCEKRKPVWLIFALLSAIFASFTSILAKIGIENVNSNLATSIRTCVVFVMAWLIVIFKKEIKFVKTIKFKEAFFLILSGIVTGVSWLCYYYAIQQGQVSVVVPIDKLSILITVLFSLIVFKEKISKKAWLGLFLLTLGTILITIFS